MEDLSPPLSSPGAPRPTSPTPAPTPGPAATSILSPSPALGASSTTPNRSSLGSPCATVGRSKAQRWNDASPSSSQSGDARPSFRDVLLAGASRAGRGTTSSPGSRGVFPAVVAPVPAASSASGEARHPVTNLVAHGMVASQASVSTVPSASLLPVVSGGARPMSRPSARPHGACSGLWHRSGGKIFPPPAAGRLRFIKQRWASKPDSEGWRKCHFSRGLGHRQQPARPRRRVPTDLHGKCFNCFSTAHLVVQCRQRPRCFRCRALGHRSYSCPGPNLIPQRRLVWRPTAPSTTTGCTAPSQRSAPASAGQVAASTAPSQRSTPASAGRVAASTAPSQRPSPAILELGVLCSPTDHVVAMTSDRSAVQEANQGGGRRRRRRPRFRRRADAGQSESTAPPDAPPLGTEETMEDLAAPTLDEQTDKPCIINWSSRIARAEEDLVHAVIVTVIGASPLAPAHAVADILAAKLNVEASSLVLRRASPSSYLLMLPDVSLVNRLVSQQQPLRSPEFSLCAKNGAG
ncbi:hypothetical protein PVAP13_3KG207177 [Panicum virgatum]|uniref:CCHC-type domain-containing protein n=1 Tax=Panicum virgatum TaxID=38727 RepID=A0A8T0UXH9_PANVG|nr:hypothetical protein PVAP13_3KG207177 [Panicum virgatum]